MAHSITQADLDILKQSKRIVRLKIELLNHALKTIDQIDGDLIADDYSISADSDIRRTYSLTIQVQDSSFIIGEDRKIWFDKYIRISAGIYHFKSKEYVWYPMGLYLFEGAGYNYDASTNELSLSCVDLMAQFTGSRNGQLSGHSTTIESQTQIYEYTFDGTTKVTSHTDTSYSGEKLVAGFTYEVTYSGTTYTIEADNAISADYPSLTVSSEDGSKLYFMVNKSGFLVFDEGEFTTYTITVYKCNSVRNAMISTVAQLGGVSRYRIDDMSEVVPYDLEFGTGSCVYDIIKELRDLYVGWETFFDDDTFVCQQYPSCESDPVVLEADLLRDLVISESTSIDFTSMGNVAEVWGGCLESDYYTSDVSTTTKNSKQVYELTYGNVVGLTHGTRFGFKACADNLAGARIKVDGFDDYPIVAENNEQIEAGRILAGSLYIVKYVRSGSINRFYFCGTYQTCGIAKLVTTEPSDEQKAEDRLNEPHENIAYVVEPDSPYCLDLPNIGEVRKVYSDGEYVNISSDSLAIQRAKYELWQSTDRLDTIQLEMIEIPWLDVNQKIEYRSDTTGETDTYIVKSKSGSMAENTMNISCVKFKPTYSWTT